MSIDGISDIIPETVKEILETIGDDAVLRKSENHQQALQMLSQWNGGHALDAAGPVVYYKLLYAIMGGNEVINNQGFKLNKEGQYKVAFGPALRILLDFADFENSISINPTGQSGHILSRHYDDQAEMFNSGKFRKQMMNKEEIEASCRNVLRLVPGE